MKKNIFNAKFEDSLNLHDDAIISFALNNFLKEVETEEKMALRGTLKSTIWVIILAIIFVFGLNLLPAFLSDLTFRSSSFNDFLVPPATNFMTYKLYYIFAIVWLGVVFFGKLLNQRFILGYRGHFHIFVTDILWFLIELNLFFITFIFPTLGKLNAILFSALNVFIFILLFYFRYQSIKKCLYGDAEKESKSVRVLGEGLQFLKKYGGFIIFILAFTSFFLRNRTMELSDNITFLSFLVLILALNSIVAVFEIYLILPYLLTGYYKLKYPEEYRNWEGKTKTEFYGNSYLKKHKELTEND